MQTNFPVKDKWLGNVVQRRENRDFRWQDWRKEKALSWPKSFATVPDIPDVIRSHQQDAVNQNIDNEAERHMPRMNFLHGRSMGRLLEDPDECKLYLDSPLLFDKSNGIKNRQNLSDDSTKDANDIDNALTDKNSRFRKARGGLRDLIRLHEEEIARASGSKQIYAKRPKHEDMLQAQSSCLSEEEGRINHEKIPSDEGVIDYVKSETKDNMFVENKAMVFETTTPTASFVNVTSMNIASNLPKMDKSTSTEDIELHLREDIALSFDKKIMEKEDLINTLIQEKESLVVKLEEQRKVANAYQKLEDRYRRRVYDLEKMMFSCTCGVLDSRSTSEQDLTKTLSSRIEFRRSNSQLEMQQPKKVDNIINELESWIMDQKGMQILHDNSSDIQDFMASESSLSSLSDVRLSNFPFEFIDQFDATSV
eukprot:gene16686-8128_t